ncbi:hypothetical protein [Lentzea nigeriaca]|uniref:hypothetical protein n=1 Tax=Lentzea nigeriaca TaxID=1128665 RepID=UPI001959994B|nr:hypothetical protein [Lentzea nigeriaca]MBM7857145.1 hypothetical protein [Lentzea nigeriaca]
MPTKLLWVGVGMTGVATFIGGRRLVVRARRHLADVLGSADQLESGSFVLYLRTFDDDAARRATQHTHLWDAGGLLRLFFLSGRTQEEQLAVALRPAGALVAVGRPGEDLPEVGALRLYLPDDAWQTAVLDLMRRARLVVLAVGGGQGLLWELSRAVEHVAPHRLVLFVDLLPDGYAEFRAAAAGVLPQLPDHPLTSPFVILFDTGWTPAVALPARRSGLERRNQLAADLTEVLGPVFHRLNARD